jgi:DNA-binding NarL/FixJ family response regulator
MPIRVLLATASDVTSAVVQLALREEPGVTLLGRAVNFRQTMQMRYPKPDLLLMDVHLPEQINATSAFVKGQLCSIPLIVIATVNDAESRALAASYGALALLDSMKLGGELVSTLIKLAGPELGKILRSHPWCAAVRAAGQQPDLDANDPWSQAAGTSDSI